MTSKVDRAANTDGKVSVNLDQAFVVALIIIITGPRFARHKFHVEGFTRRQVDMLRRASFAFGNRGFKNRLQPVLWYSISFVEAVDARGKCASTGNKLLKTSQHGVVVCQRHEVGYRCKLTLGFVVERKFAAL